MNTERIAGYYWCKDWYGKWTICQWKIKELTNESYWSICGHENDLQDAAFEVINENRIEPPTN